jgi:hypothetical protein
MLVSLPIRIILLCPTHVGTSTGKSFCINKLSKSNLPADLTVRTPGIATCLRQEQTANNTTLGVVWVDTPGRGEPVFAEGWFCCWCYVTWAGCSLLLLLLLLLCVCVCAWLGFSQVVLARNRHVGCHGCPKSDGWSASPSDCGRVQCGACCRESDGLGAAGDNFEYAMTHERLFRGTHCAADIQYMIKQSGKEIIVIHNFKSAHDRQTFHTCIRVCGHAWADELSVSHVHL